jgi:hypothetical protein
MAKIRKIERPKKPRIYASEYRKKWLFQLLLIDTKGMSPYQKKRHAKLLDESAQDSGREAFGY